MPSFYLELIVNCSPPLLFSAENDEVDELKIVADSVSVSDENTIPITIKTAKNIIFEIFILLILPGFERS